MGRGGLGWLVLMVAISSIGRLLINSRPSTSSPGFSCDICDVPGDIYYWLHSFDPAMIGSADRTMLAAITGISVVVLAGVWGIARFVKR